MRSLILALALTASVSAQALEDVIYKKDGSVLRGSLIEQDFENGRYKIQVQGGSIFAVSKDEISKISKEAPLNNTVNNDSGVNINIENNPTITQSPSQSIQQTSTLPTYSYSGDQPVEKRHSIRIGRMTKDVTHTYDGGEYGVGFTGINIAYQFNLDEHIAFYTEYNNGDLTSDINDGEHYEVSSAEEDNISFRGLEASAMLSTNNYKGWQFYAGLGLFNESFEVFGASESATGTVVTLGMGYDWQPIQLQFRISAHNSSDYSGKVFNDDYDWSSSNTALQLAFNY